MRKFSHQTHRASLSELNITPLLDLVFVLLVIFMITTPLMEQQMDVRLPSAKPQVEEIDPAAVHQVAIDANGKIYFEEHLVNLPTLQQSLSALKSSNPNAAVALRADANLRYQQLIDVLQTIKESGLKLGLATVPEPSK